MLLVLLEQPWPTRGSRGQRSSLTRRRKDGTLRFPKDWSSFTTITYSVGIGWVDYNVALKCSWNYQYFLCPSYPSMWPNAIIYFTKWYHIVSKAPNAPYYLPWLLYITGASPIDTIIFPARPTAQPGIHDMPMYLDHGWWRHRLGHILNSAWMNVFHPITFMTGWALSSTFYVGTRHSCCHCTAWEVV